MRHNVRAARLHDLPQPLEVLSRLGCGRGS
jgi:hypothetical protein